MDENKLELNITDRRSIVEANNLIEFCSRLVIKEDDKATAAENNESLSNGGKYLNAMLKSDDLSQYSISTQDLIDLQEANRIYSLFDDSAFDPFKIDKSKIASYSWAEYLLELKRFQFYQNYTEKNSYYKELHDLYVVENENPIKNLKSFIENTNLPFYAAIRVYSDFSLIYTPNGIFSDIETKAFKECYNKAKTYFLRVCYNEAYKIDNPKYNDLCKLVIVFNAMELFLNERMADKTNIDLFDEYSIRNMFLSYGLDYFFDFPLGYQKRVLKNINFLIKNKGTNRAILNVLNIFGFENVKVMKYVLCKEYPVDENGNIDLSSPELKFYGLDITLLDIEKALTDDTVVKYEYGDFTKDDKYWQLSALEKKQLLEEAFTYIYTKYISIDTFLDLQKASIQFTQFASILMDIEKKYENNEAGINYLNFFNYKISPKKISLYNAMMTMYLIIAKKYKMNDNIIKEPTSIMKLHGFNYDTLLDDVKAFTEKYITTNYLNKEYKEYTDLLCIYGLYDIYKKDILDNKEYKYKYIKNEITKEEYENVIKAYKTTITKTTKINGKKIVISDICKDYLSGKISDNEFDSYIIGSNLDPKLILFEYFSVQFFLYDFNNDEYNLFLTKYQLDKNETLLKYFIQKYLYLEITDKQLEDYINYYELDTTGFNMVQIKAYHDLNNMTITEEEYRLALDTYKIGNEDIVKAINDYINGKISLPKCKALVYDANPELRFSDVVYNYFTYKYLDDEYSTAKYLDTIEYYKLNINNIYDTESIIKTKNSYKNNDITYAEFSTYRESFNIPDKIKEKIDDYDNGLISETSFVYYMTKNNYDIPSYRFKYITYKYLDVDVIEARFDYWMKLMDLYDDNKDRIDAIKVFKSSYYMNYLDHKKYNEYVETFNPNCKRYYTVKKFLENNTIEKYKDENITPIHYTSNMTLDLFNELYTNNIEFREKLEEEILRTTDYEKYRQLKLYYECCFEANYRHELFEGFTTYSQYIKYRDEELYNYVQKIEEKTASMTDQSAIDMEYDDAILEICSSITTYLETDEFEFIIQNNPIINGYIKNFVYEMIDFIKSYTIQIKDINTILTFSDKYLNRFFIFDVLDNIGGDSELSYADLISHLSDKLTPDSYFDVPEEIFVEFEELIKYRQELHYKEDKNQFIPYDKSEMYYLDNFSISDLIFALKEFAEFKHTSNIIDLMNEFKDDIMITYPNMYNDKFLLFFKSILANKIPKSDLISNLYDNAGMNNIIHNIGVTLLFNANEKLLNELLLTHNEHYKLNDKEITNKNIDYLSDLMPHNDKIEIESKSDIIDARILSDKNIKFYNDDINIIPFENILRECKIFENDNIIIFDLTKLNILKEKNIDLSFIGELDEIYDKELNKISKKEYNYNNRDLYLTKNYSNDILNIVFKNPKITI